MKGRPRKRGKDKIEREMSEGAASVVDNKSMRTRVPSERSKRDALENGKD